MATERLTIQGANAGQDATRGDRHAESIVTGDPATTAERVVQLLENGITWDGFLIRGTRLAKNGPGMYTSPTHSGYTILNTIFEDNGVGLYLGSDGADQTTVCRNRFTANNEFTGDAAGYGIYSDEGARDVTIADNRFERHSGAGIPVRGQQHRHPPARRAGGGNKSVEDRTFAAFFATFGLLLKRNVVRARPTDLDPRLRTPVSAIFIGARNENVVLYRNRAQAASGNGIDVTDSGNPDFKTAAPTNVDLLKNWVQHAQLLGISVSASGLRQYELRGNRAVDNVMVGLHLGPATDGTAGTENSWDDNAGNSDRPEGICGPPGPEKPRDGDHHKKKKRKKRDPCRCSLPWRY